jgi:indolepyruvate ferredoxin oxidoreductase
LWAAQKLLDEHAIRFVPGLNEELAVSAIRGTQELDWFGKSGLDGVFGLWYGKGIGVDRACESLKLGNLEGAAAKGGFLAVAGDDHGGKSSDSAHQSEQTLIAAFLPVLYPATIGEILEYRTVRLGDVAVQRLLRGAQVHHRHAGSHGIGRASRHSPPYTIPTDIELPPGGLNLRQNQPPLVEEDRLVNWRLPAATAFARANGIDRTVIDGERRSCPS